MVEVKRNIDQQKDLQTTDNLCAEVTEEVVDARTTEEGTIYKTLKDRLDNENNVNLLEEDLLGGKIEDRYMVELESLKNNINTSKFNLGFFTDGHFEESISHAGGYDHSAETLNHLTNIQYVSDKLDCLILGGDNAHSDSPDLSVVKSQYRKLLTKVQSKQTKCDVMITIGNHDDGSRRNARAILARELKPSEVLHDSDFKELIGSSTWTYKDYPEKKVRVIVVNTSDVNPIANDKGFIKYPRLLHHAFSQEQLSWLAKEALQNVPEDYVTIMLGHCALDNGWDASNSGSTTHTHPLMIKLIDAFILGQEINEIYTESDFERTINSSFKMQGPRKFAGFFAGHFHNQNVYPQTNFNSYTCMNSVFNPEQSNRQAGSAKEDAWTIIELDRENQKINLKGYGYANTRSFDY